MTVTETTTTTTTERKQKRRSSFEQSNHSKAGVLEWMAWARADPAFGDGPKPVKRESIHSNVHQEWIGEEEEEEEEEKHVKKPQRRFTKTHSDDWEELDKARKDITETGTTSSGRNDGGDDNWLTKNMYGLIAAGAVMVVAIGINMAFSKEKATSGNHS
jgi:hypothetical protein